jgi:hypothetical protein
MSQWSAAAVVQPAGTCEMCGRAAETRQVGFMRSIGAIVLHFSRTVHGNMCRFCVERYFWRYTLVSVLFGWWGVVSFFMTAIWVPINIVCYLRCLGLPAPPDDDDSRRERRGRGLGAMGCAAALGLLAALGMAFGASQAFGPAHGDTTAGMVLLALCGGLLGIPALLVFVAGVWTYVRGRAKAKSAP